MSHLQRFIARGSIDEAIVNTVTANVTRVDPVYSGSSFGQSSSLSPTPGYGQVTPLPSNPSYGQSRKLNNIKEEIVNPVTHPSPSHSSLQSRTLTRTQSEDMPRDRVVLTPVGNRGSLPEPDIKAAEVIAREEATVQGSTQETLENG